MRERSFPVCRKNSLFMRMLLALLTVRFLGWVLRLFGRGSNKPGVIALKICPDILGKFQFRGKVLAVTGSDGKTSTVNVIAHILRQCGKTVAVNSKGSNLKPGIVTALATASDWKGVLKQDFVVLEVDERYSVEVFSWFTPDMMLITNLFRDQLTRNGNVDCVAEKLRQAIAPSVKLILNGDDPISSSLCRENPRVYFTLADNEKSQKEMEFLTNDAKVCPLCLHPLSYQYYLYNHIGSFACAHCGFHTPEAPEYTADNLDFAGESFTVNGQTVKTSFMALFHIMNVTSAIACAVELGIPLEQAAEAASTFVYLKSRMKEFSVCGRRALMLLSKNQNPISFDQSISCVLDEEGEKSVIIYVNNINHTNFKDTTWLYDISFHRLKGQVDSIVCTGPRALDLAVCLKLEGFEEEIKVECDLNKLRSVVDQTKGTLLILTELYDANAVIKAIS